MARNPNRGSGGRTTRDYNKKYTDKDRPSGWYQVEGKGKRWWNSYTNKWTRSPVGSTDDMIRKAHSEGKIPTATNTGSPRGGGRTTKTDKEKPTTPTSGPKTRPAGATGGRGRGTSTYTVAGITYDSKTGRPVVVPKNRRPVQAQDNTKKDPPAGGGGSSDSSSSSSSGSQSSSSNSGRQRETRPSSETHKTPPTAPPKLETPKPKSRLEKALSWASDEKNKDAWMSKKKETRNKPTSRFLKKTNNTRRK